MKNKPSLLRRNGGKMANIFSRLINKITGGGAKASAQAESIVQETLQGVVDRSGLALEFTTAVDGENINVEFSGDDSESLTEREGALLDAFQFYIKRVLQHQLPDERVEVNMDSGGYRESSTNELIELADKLRDLVLERGRPVFVRSLPPRDRKVIHRHLAEDERIKCRSIGDGLYKKIKISLTTDSATMGSGDTEGGEDQTGGEERRPPRGGGNRGGGRGGRGGGANRRGGRGSRRGGNYADRRPQHQNYNESSESQSTSSETGDKQAPLVEL